MAKRVKVFSPYCDVRKEAPQRARDELPHGLRGHEIARAGQFWDETIGRQEAERLGAVRTRLDALLPISGSGPYGSVESFLGDVLPEGSNLNPGAGAGYRNSIHASRQRANGAPGPTSPFGSRTAATTGNSYFSTPVPGNLSNRTFTTSQRPYQPELESADRQSFPVHRILANRCWRLFWKLDPLIGNTIEMLADLVWSDFELTGEGVDGEIKERCEFMVKETALRSVLPALVREYLVVGEAAPHNYFSDNEGVWTYVALHNPDQLEVIDAPFIKMDPVVEFIPDDRLREVLTSAHPLLREVRESMPDALVSKLMSRQNVPLMPLNFTFIPRKLHPYDTRGTSILSRMWRILMYEDAIYNASLATARRHAGPIKVAKVGDPASGWTPTPEHQRSLLEMLAQAEMDPLAWIVYNYAVSFELVGSTDRVMTIDRHNDLIERIKLMALGVSKSFTYGEVTYASAASGLTIFFQRLKTLREFFEAVWLYPKFFAPVSRINKWVKPTPAELSHRVRTRRSSREVSDDSRLIIPVVSWDRQLDPQIDAEKINALNTLASNLGVRFSKRTLMATVNEDWEAEMKAAVEEAETELKMAREHPEAAALLGLAAGPAGQEGGAGGGGGMGAPIGPPPISPDTFSDFGAPEGGVGPPPGAEAPPEGPEAPPAGPEGAKHSSEDAGGAKENEKMTPERAVNEAREEGATKPRLTSSLWDEEGRYGDWFEDDVADLVDLIQTGDPKTDNETWEAMLHESPMAKAAIEADDRDLFWGAFEDWMVNSGYPAKAVRDIEDLLITEKVLDGPTSQERLALRKESARILSDSAHLPDENLITGSTTPRKH